MKAHEDLHSNHTHTCPSTHKHTPRKMAVSHLCQVRLCLFFRFGRSPSPLLTFKPQLRIFKPGRIYSVCQPCPKPLRPFYRDKNAFVASFLELSSEDRLDAGFSGNDCNFGVHTLHVNKVVFFLLTNNNNSVQKKHIFSVTFSQFPKLPWCLMHPGHAHYRPLRLQSFPNDSRPIYTRINVTYNC